MTAEKIRDLINLGKEIKYFMGILSDSKLLDLSIALNDKIQQLNEEHLDILCYGFLHF